MQNQKRGEEEKKMTYEEKKRYLSQYVCLKNIISALLSDRAYWQSVGVSMAAGGGSGNGKSSGSKVETSAVNIAKITAEIEAEIKECVEVRKNIRNAIERLGNGKYKTVLYDVYIDGKSRDQVANDRGTSVNNINTIIYRALEKMDM